MLVFCQVNVLGKFAKMSDLEVWQGKWLGSLAGSRWREEEEEAGALLLGRDEALFCENGNARRTENNGEPISNAV